MARTNIKAIIQSDIHNIWKIVLAVENYDKWRSDVSKTEIINEKKFIEYTKDGYSTTFTVTVIKPLNRWEFDMENTNMKGHWVGIFTSKDDKTEIDFTEQVLKKTASTVRYGFKKNIGEINPKLSLKNWNFEWRDFLEHNLKS